jgi:hypothetical protein
MTDYNPDTHSKIGFDMVYEYQNGKLGQHCKYTFLVSKEDISKNGFESAVSPHIYKILNPGVANWVNKRYLCKNNTFRKGNGYTFTQNLISYLQSKPDIPENLNTFYKLKFDPENGGDIRRLLGFNKPSKFPVINVEDTSTYTDDEKVSCINTLIEELTWHFTRVVFEPVDIINFDSDCMGGGAFVCVEEIRPVMVCYNKISSPHY